MVARFIPCKLPRMGIPHELEQRWIRITEDQRCPGRSIRTATCRSGAGSTRPRTPDPASRCGENPWRSGTNRSVAGSPDNAGARDRIQESACDTIIPGRRRVQMLPEQEIAGIPSGEACCSRVSAERRMTPRRALYLWMIVLISPGARNLSRSLSRASRSNGAASAGRPRARSATPFQYSASG